MEQEAAHSSPPPPPRGLQQFTEESAEEEKDWMQIKSDFQFTTDGLKEISGLSVDRGARWWENNGGTVYIFHYNSKYGQISLHYL